MLKTESAGGIVMNETGEIALVKSGPDFWGFPKGHIDEGEDALTAAKREIAEETGLDDIEFVQAFEPYERYRGRPDGGDDTEELKTIHMFLFKTHDQELAPRDEWNPEAKWEDPARVADLLTHPKDRAFYESVLPLLREHAEDDLSKKADKEEYERDDE